MIKDILIPEKIGNYYLIAQRIIGFEITKNKISATQIYVTGKLQTSIEKYIEEYFSNENDIAASIKNILNKTDKFNQIKVAFPSYLTIYKELTFPFTDIDKIKSVLEFEIESALPFPIEESVSDFIILNKDSKNKQTTVLVAIARKKDVQDLLKHFQNAGVNVDSVIVDILGIYGLYKAIHKFQNYKQGTILLNIEFNLINIAYLQNGQLKLIRSLNHGIYNVAKKISDEIKMGVDETTELIFRYGLEHTKENSNYNNAITKAISDLLSEIQFTLNSFQTLLPDFQEIKKIILIGHVVDIKDLCKLINNKLNTDCEILNINSVIESKNFKIKKRNFPNACITSLAIAYPSAIAENFNLLQKELALTNSSLLKKQLLVSLVLFLSVFIILISFSINQIKKLRNEVNSSKNEILTVLKKTFEISNPSTLKNLQLTIQEASTKINEEQAIWFAFSQTARFSFLKYLQELSSLIDSKAIGLDLKKLTITPDIITLEGEVKDFKGLEILENSLSESKLFSHISVPQETKFTIKITLNKNNEEAL